MELLNYFLFELIIVSGDSSFVCIGVFVPVVIVNPQMLAISTSISTLIIHLSAYECNFSSLNGLRSQGYFNFANILPIVRVIDFNSTSLMIRRIFFYTSDIL